MKHKIWQRKINTLGFVNGTINCTVSPLVAVLERIRGKNMYSMCTLMMYSNDDWLSYNLILYVRIFSYRTYSMSRQSTRLNDQNWRECKLQKIAGK